MSIHYKSSNNWTSNEFGFRMIEKGDFMSPGKLFFRVLLILLITSSLFAGVREDIQRLVQDFSIEYKLDNPDLVFRPNIGILPFSNLSPDAEKYSVGQAVSSLVENTFSRSLLFSVIDDRIRDNLMKEIKFSLSGLADTDRIEPGRIEGIDYFVDGSVVQLGESFTVSLRVVEVNTSRVIFSSETTIPKYDIVDYSEKLAAAYVSTYGLGMEIYLTPFYYLNSDMSDIEGQIEEGWPMGFTLNYRISRNLIVWLGMEGTTGAFRLNDTFETRDYVSLDLANVDDTVNLDVDASSIGYHKERTYATGQIGFGYVFNFSRKFNVTLGGDMKLGMSFLQQFYKMPTVNDPELLTHIIKSQDMTFIILSPVVKFQYYVTPRITLNLDYSYGFQVIQDESSSYIYGDQRVDSDGGFYPELFGLHPGVDPEGNKHVIDFSGHRIRMGFGLYF
jgi:TolB-like protein